MSNERFASVWDAIEDTPEQGENMKLRSALMLALKGHVSRASLNRSQTAKLFGVTQPRVSDLMRGKIDSSAWTPWSTWRLRQVCGSKSKFRTRRHSGAEVSTVAAESHFLAS